MRNDKYPFTTVEQKWRPIWQQLDLYRTGSDPDKPNIYILDFFPYPSGAGLSVGHGRNYVPTCVDARFHRMRGYNVLHPMGWDAFGLPAENYAIDHAIHPQESTRIFTNTYRRQMELLACSYDWAREINSSDPAYYRWTQWLFRLLFQRGLAYQAEADQWWCATCQTILANEQVEQGNCWRCHQPVGKKRLRQWYFRITAYAERLLADLEEIDWPEPIKQMQRNWIGRSSGAEVVFQLPVGEVVHELPVFTTRPDTLFGVTFLALAPEHPLLPAIVQPEQATAVAEYVTTSQRISEIERMSTTRTQSGVFTGATARHPLTGAAVPVWVADYVLPGYGHGAVMGVPAHDERDYAFAQAYGLPIVTVIRPAAAREAGLAKAEAPACFTGEGMMVNSGPYTGLTSAAGGAQLAADLAAQAAAGPSIAYRMRDWLVSRQRYWGAPIPIIHCADCGMVAVPESDLPVLLPEMADFAPAGDGRSPLARATDWLHTACPQCGRPAQRETDTMDGFVCSSWYFLRFANPHYADGPFDPAAVAQWLPVDTYVGGAEHAVMHLLYARFFTKALYDAGLIEFSEPFQQLKNQGVLHAADGRRMSKSRDNVVTPDEVIAQYGADALRAYILFLGPFDGDVNWDERGIVGVSRFLDRFWRLSQTVPLDGPLAAEAETDESFERARQRAIQQVTADMEQFRYNTAVAGLMSYLNELVAQTEDPIPEHQWRQALETFCLLLAPICPFIAEAVWQERLGHQESVHRQSWPAFDPALAVAETTTIVIQVNGKVRARLTAAADADEAWLRQTAVAQPDVQRHLNGRAIRQVIVVPNRLVNIVVD